MFSIYLASCAFLLVSLHPIASLASPAKRSVRTLREVYPPEIELPSPENDGNQAQVCIVGDVVYGIDETVPAEQPCLKCRCQPPVVQCETIRCVKKTGCKAIHRPNKCCPDYQCECNHDGQIYGNGERLPTSPGGECQVCYCRGGEVQCTNVSCYIRTDCEGKTVPGQCCPKYDNCPPKDITSHNSIHPEPISNLNNTIEVHPTETKQIPEPQITIHEIIPETNKEIIITQPSIEAVSSDNDVVTDSEPESSDISEVFHQPPPVLRIGDKLLFLKEGEFVAEMDANTPAPVITIIGAEGLQRGEDSGEIHEVPEVGSTDNDLETRATESHILSLVKRKNYKTSGTTTTTTESSSTTTESSDNSTFEVETSTILQTTPSDAQKILPEVLEIRNNASITNTSHNEWLKETEETMINPRAVLPEELLRQKSDSDLEIDIEEEDPGSELDASGTTTQIPRSMETIEESSEESRESTTKFDHSSLISNDSDSLSIETNTNEESDDMVKIESTTYYSTRIDDVEVFNNETVESTTTSVINLEEVEILPKKLGKRENSKQDEEDEIFRQLNQELNADTTEKNQTEEEEKQESEQIFKQLLEDTSTPKSTRKLSKEEETLQKVSDAIAKLTLRGKTTGFDGDLLKIVSNFLGAQFRQEKKK